jgi:hypothetical protein
VSKIIIGIFIVAIIAIGCIVTHVFDKPTEVSKIMYNGTEMSQTPFTIVTIPKGQTPEPTPTPQYYHKFKYPDEPCSETLEIFNRDCMGRTKDEAYCEYWDYQTRKNCKFVQW